MALFCTNICTYENCNIILPNLHELICHIERNHLDFDANTIEKYENEKIDLIPFSYILKYSRNENLNNSEENLKNNNEFIQHNVNDLMNNNAAYQEPIEVPSRKDDGLKDDFPQCSGISEYRIPQCYQVVDNKIKKLKKYVCPVPGCHKRYKNINGIKYHSRNVHDKNFLPFSYKCFKNYKCHCGKAYKTAQGLKIHSSTHNNIRYGYDDKNNNNLIFGSMKFDHQSTSKCVIVEPAPLSYMPNYESDV